MTQQIPSWRDARSSSEVLTSHVQSLTALMLDLDLSAVEGVGDLLDRACQQGATIFCAGNGGSAATASHITADLSWGRRTSDEPRPRAVSLVSNTPLMTALANDVGYADVFVEQLKSAFRPDDVLIAVSASGNSENLLRAVDFVKNHGGTSVGLTGFDGGKLRDICDLCVYVPTPLGEYELVEDVHHAVCHMFANDLKYRAAQRASDNSQGA